MSDRESTAAMPSAIILCGGQGLRLRSVTSNSPKAMARIGNRPFLELLLHQLRRHGFERVILAVGYQKELIGSHFGERSAGLELEYSAESTPLGTGGAMRDAAALVDSDPVLVMNGDSYTDLDLRRLVTEHRNAQADVTIAVVPADGRDDCGNIQVDQNGNLALFEEKRRVDGPQYMNAGVYVVSQRVVGGMPTGSRISLENELFPRWLRAGKRVRAFVHSGECIDIGTPERYRSAQRILAEAELGGAAQGGVKQL